MLVFKLPKKVLEKGISVVLIALKMLKLYIFGSGSFLLFTI